MNQLQYKLVFIKAVDLNQLSSPPFAVRLGPVPSRNVTAHDVTIAFELRASNFQGNNLEINKNWFEFSPYSEEHKTRKR